MKRTAPWIVAVLLFTTSGVASVHAQPTTGTPAAAAAKAKKGKGKKPKADAGAPAPDAGLAPDPYGLGGVTTTAKPGGPLEPYVPPPAAIAPKPAPVPATRGPAAVGGTPVDPYATPSAPAPAPSPTTGSAPLDPYASLPPTTGSAPRPTTPGAPLEPSAPTPTPPPTGAVPTDPYGLGAAPSDAGTAVATGRLDVAAVQGLLAVQSLDGWLLADVGGQNSVARTLVAPAGAPTRRWFYLIPRTGEPTLLCHVAEVASFAALPGRHVAYAGYRDLDKAVKALLKGKKTVAMEYSPKSAVPSLSQIDAGTLELVRAAAVTVKTSEVLVQFVKASWGPQGRRNHYVAVHHLVELRKEALAFLRDQLAAGKPVTELDVQQLVLKGMALRGLIGPPPVIAFGPHTADPDYVPTPERSATLMRGDPVLLSLAGKVDGGVYAALTWVAVADRAPSAELAATFDAAARARDEALALVRDRLKRRRAVQGWEVDHAARDLLARGGLDGHAIHRTGHSLDTDLQGSGTDLDDLEVKDKRNLVIGTGFTVGPGLYYPGELGVRTEISVFLGKDGPEITTPVQDHVEALLGP